MQKMNITLARINPVYWTVQDVEKREISMKEQMISVEIEH